MPCAQCRPLYNLCSSLAQSWVCKQGQAKSERMTQRELLAVHLHDATYPCGRLIFVSEPQKRLHTALVHSSQAGVMLLRT